MVDFTTKFRPRVFTKTNFPTTQWTAVVKAARSDDARHREAALTGLCQDYWYPVYAFARQIGRKQEDAEDLTQGFFSYVLERNVLASASLELGTLRTFLLKVFQRYIGDVRDREQALKRGGGQEIFSLNIAEGEAYYGREAAASDTPETIFDRSWAHAVLRGALWYLGETEKQEGRERQFTALEPFLNPDEVAEGKYEQAGAALGMNVEAVRQAVSRLRRKYRDCLRARIAATLHEPDEARVDEEILALKMALRE